MHPRFDCSQRNFQLVGDFGVRHFALMKQLETAAVLVAQLGQRQRKLLREQVAGVRKMRIVANRELQCLHEGAICPLAQSRAAAISRDRQQPRLKIPLRIPAMQIAKDPNKRLLGHILGIVMMPQHSQAQAVDTRLKTTYQIANRALATGETLSNQQLELVWQA